MAVTQICTDECIQFVTVTCIFLIYFERYKYFELVLFVLRLEQRCRNCFVFLSVYSQNYIVLQILQIALFSLLHAVK